MKITRESIVKLYNVFEGMKDRKTSVKFAYFLAKNKKLLQPEVDILKEITVNVPDKYKEYELKRVQCAVRFSEKDINGKPIIVGKNYDIRDENLKVFTEEVERLKEVYKEAIDELKNNTGQYNEMLKEEVDVPDLFQIKIDDITEDIEPYIMELFIEFDLVY